MELPERTARVRRQTAETNVIAEVNLDKAGTYSHNTGIGFMDHMLDLFARHSGISIDINCDGDLYVDDHHTVEDVGITLGQAINEALDAKEYIARYGHMYVPMDDVLARAVIDLSGRFYFHFDADFTRDRVGDLSTEMVGHFWYSLAEHVRCNLHLSVLYGHNAHHQVEALFKAGARAFRKAIRRGQSHGRIASTKETL